MGPQARIFKKVLEFLACLACLLGKFFTDVEARRIFLTRQKWSREWSLLNNIFWNNKGDAFAWITYGGYSIITLLFGISICIDSKSRPTYAEKIFLFIGSLMFFAVGGMVLAAIDQVPDDLIDNAIVLGCLSFFVAFLFLIDMSEKMGKRRTDATQTDSSSIDRHFAKSRSTTTLNSQANLMDSSEFNRESIRSNGQRETNGQQPIAQSSSNPFVIQQQPIATQQQPIVTQQRANDQRQQTSPQEQSYHVHYPEQSYSEDVVETQTLPSVQTPVFSKVKQPPTALNHFESEPYKKILTRNSQQPAQAGSQSQPHSYTRYHDPAQHHNDPTFYDDFQNYRRQTYYQGPKVDQGRLMVIRDYSKNPQQSQKQACNCQHHDHDEHEHADASIKSGYVSQVAKLWDDRMKSNQGSVRGHQKDIRGLNTVV